MIRLYSDNDLLMAMRQKRKILTIYFCVLAVYLLAFAAVTVSYVMLPYGDPMAKWHTVIASALTCLFVIFSFPYLGICFKRIRDYCNMLNYISEGLKETLVAPFEGIEDWVTHDGVDVNVASFTVRGVKRDEVMSRHIYIDGEKDFPAFQEGDTVRMVLQGNLLVEYEIEKHAEEGEEICAQS